MPDSERFQVPIPEEPKRLAIVFCSHDRVHAGWTYDFVHLVGHFVSQGGYVPETGDSYMLSINWCQTSLLPEGRHRLVEDMRGKSIKKILWIDTDMRFPKEALNMLLRHGKPIVGCNYVSRRPPHRWTAATLDKRPLITKIGDSGLVEVSHAPFGLMLTDMEVFQGDGPWFAFDWNRDRDDGRWNIVGEDVWFCREAQANGYQIYVDQELSARISHIGELEYSAALMEQVESAPVA